MRYLLPLLLAGFVNADVETLRKEIEALRAPKDHIWRAVKWKTCLLDGLRESSRAKKPVLLWVFIHNPSVERC